MRALVVDLDGTLVKTDLFFESGLAAVKRNPLVLLLAPVWLMNGKARLKAELAQRGPVRISALPYNKVVVDLAESRARAGHEVVLATGSNKLIAEQVATYLGFFDAVLASDGSINLVGKRKGAALMGRFADRPFGYAGNSHADVPIWLESKEVIVVDPDVGLLEELRRLRISPDVLVEGRRPYFSSFRRLVWPSGWRGTLVPLLLALFVLGASGRVEWLRAALACLAVFASMAGGVIAGQLTRVEADRNDQAKCARPLATGDIPLLHGAILAVAFTCAGTALGLVTAPAGLLGAMLGFIAGALLN